MADVFCTNCGAKLTETENSARRAERLSLRMRKIRDHRSRGNIRPPGGLIIRGPQISGIRQWGSAAISACFFVVYARSRD